MRRPGGEPRNVKPAQGKDWASPPAYVMIAKTDRPEHPWDICGLFENPYDASDAAGSLCGVSTLVCQLVLISRNGHREARMCRLCGEPFESLRYNQAYCNPGCRMEAELRRRKLARTQRKQG